MKKVFLVVFLTVFLLCGCNFSQNVKINTENVSFKFDLKKGETSYSFKAETSTDGKIKKIEVLSPEEIKGLKYIPQNDGINISFEGLSRLQKENEIAKEIKTVIDILPEINRKTAEKNGKTFVYKYTKNKNLYGVIVSPTGFPLEISEKDDNISLKFKEIALVK